MSANPISQPKGTYQLSFGALLRMRWIAITGQVVVIYGAWLLIELPLLLGPLTAMLGLIAMSNILLWLWSQREGGVDSEWSLGAVLGLDVMLLTALLALSGGASNPFSVLYLMHIALASVTVGERWSWGLVSLSMAAYGMLFLIGEPQPPAHTTGMTSLLDLHLKGMWFAMGLTSISIVAFVQRIRRQLYERDRQISQLADIRSKQERLAGLATLSAGAAHELSTPLSTIALVARELERDIERKAPEQGAMIEDAQLIRSQVDRCQRILQSMAADAGEAMGELPEGVRIRDLFEEALDELMRPDGVRITASEEALETYALLGPRAMSLAMQGIIRNAREAAMERGLAVDVALDAVLEKDRVILKIIDQSGGMSEEVARRAREPFFSTKPTGRGMGIGLFLAGSLCERLDGELTIDTTEGEGTTVSLTLPIAPSPPTTSDSEETEDHLQPDSDMEKAS